MMRTRTVAAYVATATMMAVLSGCGGDTPETAGEDDSAAIGSSQMPTPESSPPAPESSLPDRESSSPDPEAVTITVESFEYTDSSPVAPGTKITVANLDDASHTLTADGAGGFDVTINPGQTGTFTAPSEPGTYPYLCTFHTGMTGTLVVEP